MCQFKPVLETDNTAGQALTVHQVNILKWICEGLSAKEVATEMGITVKTVQFHRARIEKKLQVKGTAMLVRAAIRLGYVNP